MKLTTEQIHCEESDCTARMYVKKKIVLHNNCNLFVKSTNIDCMVSQENNRREQHAFDRCSYGYASLILHFGIKRQCSLIAYPLPAVWLI